MAPSDTNVMMVKQNDIREHLKMGSCKIHIHFLILCIVCEQQKKVRTWKMYVGVFFAGDVLCENVESAAARACLCRATHTLALHENNSIWNNAIVGCECFEIDEAVNETAVNPNICSHFRNIFLRRWRWKIDSEIDFDIKWNKWAKNEPELGRCVLVSVAT